MENLLISHTDMESGDTEPPASLSGKQRTVQTPSQPLRSSLTSSPEPDDPPRAKIRMLKHSGKAGFVAGPASLAFRKRFFPQASRLDWNDWHWQVRRRIRDIESLSRIVNLSENERSALSLHDGTLPLGITMQAF